MIENDVDPILEEYLHQAIFKWQNESKLDVQDQIETIFETISQFFYGFIPLQEYLYDHNILDAKILEIKKELAIRKKEMREIIAANISAEYMQYCESMKSRNLKHLTFEEYIA
jgi:predicted thioredoxin/glutaredoxin